MGDGAFDRRTTAPRRYWNFWFRAHSVERSWIAARLDPRKVFASSKSDRLSDRVFLEGFVVPDADELNLSKISFCLSDFLLTHRSRPEAHRIEASSLSIIREALLSDLVGWISDVGRIARISCAVLNSTSTDSPGTGS